MDDSSHVFEYCLLFYRNSKEAKNQVWCNLINPLPIKRNRPGESKASKLARACRAAEKKQREERVSVAKRNSCGVPIRYDSNSMNTGEEKQLALHRRYNYRRKALISIAKYNQRNNSNPKNTDKEKPSAPRGHNYRRKALITKYNQRNCYRNKSSCYQRGRPSIYRIVASVTNHRKKSNGKKSSKPGDTARMAAHREIIMKRLYKHLYRARQVKGKLSCSFMPTSKISLIYLSQIFPTQNPRER